MVNTPFTETLPSTIKFLFTPKPPLRITPAVVELDAAVIFANVIVDSTFEKNFSIVIFLLVGVPAGSSTTRRISSLLAVVIAVRPEIRLSAIVLL